MFTFQFIIKVKKETNYNNACKNKNLSTDLLFLMKLKYAFLTMVS